MQCSRYHRLNICVLWLQVWHLITMMVGKNQWVIALSCFWPQYILSSHIKGLSLLDLITHFWIVSKANCRKCKTLSASRIRIFLPRYLSQRCFSSLRFARINLCTAFERSHHTISHIVAHRHRLEVWTCTVALHHHDTYLFISVILL